MFDEDNVACYVFKFNGKGKVDLVQFDETNIVYEDPQYFKGYTNYKLSGDTVTIKKMPKTMLIKSLNLTVKDGKLFADGKELEKHSKVKLSYAVEHFS